MFLNISIKNSVKAIKNNCFNNELVNAIIILALNIGTTMPITIVIILKIRYLINFHF